MRRRFHLLLLVLVVLPLIALARWGGEARSPWSPVASGVQARLVVPRSIWRSGRPLPLSARLRSVDGRSHELGLAVPALLTHARSGRVPATEIEAPLAAPVVVPASGTADVALATIPATDVVPGVHAFSGLLGDLALAQVKVRVIASDGAGAP